MTDKKSFHQKENSEAARAIRRTLGAGVTATVALSAALSVAFAIVLDGCSNSKNNKTQAGSSSVNPSGQAAIATPSPIGYVKPVKVTHKRNTIAHSATISYSDSLSGVSFRYPREYKLTTPDKSQPGWGMTEKAPMNFSLPGGRPVASIELSSGPATSFFEINVNKSLGEDRCSEFADPDLSEAKPHSTSPMSNDDGPIPGKISLGEVQFTEVETGTPQLDTRYYHRYDHGACYEFVMGVSKKPGNTIALDDLEVFDKMEQILTTVEIKSDAHASVAGIPVTPGRVGKPQ
jgi:hypothetical protein